MFAGSTRVRSLWTPKSINTALWLDAGDTSTVTLVGDKVSEWRDKSGNNRHATQSVSQARPTYSNNLTITFDGVDDGLIINGYSVSSRTAKPKVDFFVLAKFSLSTMAKSIISNDGDVGGWQRGLVIQNNVLEAQGGASLNRVTANVNANQFYLIGATYDYPNDFTLMLNGVNITKGNGEIGGGATFQPLSLGFGYPISTGGNSQNLIGSISDVIVIEGAVETTTRARLQGYLAHKGKIASSLPDNHPYKNYPPRGL